MNSKEAALATRYANKQEAEEAAHTLSHQPWMPHCTWKIVERDDGTAYVHGTMDASIPEGEDRAQLDALRHYLGGRFRAATASTPRSWHGRYGKAEICVLMPWRTRSDKPAPRQRSRPEPPEMAPCREGELLRENARLREALARVRQMADGWEQRLPETIRTATAVEAIRTAADRATEK